MASPSATTRTFFSTSGRGQGAARARRQSGSLAVDQKLVRELATGRFIAQAENVLLFGPPGVAWET
ncbi:hypothetical protein F0U61_19235 [Archangium violaceum]|nr:hypothetical protein F0U61_19235 [Archangium violaceum]